MKINLQAEGQAGQMRFNTARLAELQRAMILDSGLEQAYDDITRLLATTLDVPITMVNMLDAQRDWFKSRVGIQQTQSPVVSSFCEAFFGSTADLIVVQDTLLDRRFSAHPMVIARPFVRFYAAARLTVRGQTLGTLCAYDVRPRSLSDEQLDALQAMAAAAVQLIGQRVGCAAPGLSRSADGNAAI
jgi:GAF domain-containing protein